MRTKYLLLCAVLLAAFLTNPLYAMPGDKTKLGFLDKMSVSDALGQLGYSGMTCTEGTKTEDADGYTIAANCVKGRDYYLVVMWVSIDWKKGRVISATKRGSD